MPTWRIWFAPQGLRAEFLLAVAIPPDQRAEFSRRSRRVQIDRQLSETAAGILHHLQQVNVEVFDHDAVDLDHLGFG